MNQTREIIYKSHALHLMFQIETEPETGYHWHDKQGQPTKDPANVVEKIPINIQRYRTAETDSDFQTIFEREFLKEGAKDRDAFRVYQIEKMERESEKLKQFDPDTFYKTIEIIGLYVRYLNTERSKIEIPVLQDNTELKQKAQNLLTALAGNWINGMKIIANSEYKTVIEGVYWLIDTNQVKPIDKKIRTQAPQQFVRRLFWAIHNELYTTKTIKPLFIRFLHCYFECFSDSDEHTTKEHFKEYKGDFVADYKKVMKSINK